VESMDGLWNAGEQAAVKDFLALQLLGDAAAIKRQLDELLASVTVDEIMFTVDIHDPAKRRHALEILEATRP
jgi:hypothetical protein